MKVLSKRDKVIYETLMSGVTFKKIPYSNVKIPKDWLDETKRTKIDFLE